MSKVYSFRLTKSDVEVEELLEKMQGKEKQEYIRSALRFYYNFGNMLKEMNDNVKIILNKINSSNITSLEHEQKEVNKQDNNVLLESIHSLLEL